jgi:protein tyrosine/serine phosphatase
LHLGARRRKRVLIFGIPALKKLVRLVFAAACLGIAGLALSLVVQQTTGNLHTVVPGVLYRSGQLSAAELEQVVRRDGIRSVLNLRGAASGEGWYDAELAASKDAGVVHADFRMSSREILDDRRALELIALMRRLPAPVLIHCEHGSDRSGLASALFVSAVLGDDEEVAERQLSIRYGHFSVPYLSGTFAMDESFELLEPMLGYTES